MDSIHQICSKERIPCKGLVILPLEAVSVTRPRRHRETDRTSFSQLVSREFHKIARRVTQLLGGREYVDPMVQELSRLFLRQAILSHGKEDLDAHGALLRICRSCGRLRGEEE